MAPTQSPDRDRVTASPSRVAWLDGLRGLAAMQVVLLHYATAFLPAIGMYDLGRQHFPWELWVICTPLFLPFDGYSAVYLFFLMSGVALTYAYGQKPFPVLANVGRRIVRLGMPVAAAILLSGSLLALFSQVRLDAAVLAGSTGWLDAAPRQVTIAGMVHQAVFEGMLTGYSGNGFWPEWVLRPFHLAPGAESYDAPLWTLNVEFIGSLLIMVLAALRMRIGVVRHCVACILLWIAFCASPLGLFILGHLVAPRLGTVAKGRWPNRLGAACLGAGVCLCAIKPLVHVNWMLRLLPTPLLGVKCSEFQMISMIEAQLLFAGIVLLPATHAWLASPAARWFGKISFSLYLTHYPLLLTLSSGVFVAVRWCAGYGEAVIAATAAGLLASLAMAVGFERCVDRSAIVLSRRIGRPRHAAPAHPTMLLEPGPSS
jgi:peptidoglycan/LPS O-acetylase OafA/YrhL